MLIFPGRLFCGESISIDPDDYLRLVATILGLKVEPGNKEMVPEEGSEPSGFVPYGQVTPEETLNMINVLSWSLGIKPP
ncbi:MAG: hypothetical protein JXA66_01445, partial [Oligoflexia bacterium]|nr:hypothetical protein [Oligoflexia bacterium]